MKTSNFIHFFLILVLFSSGCSKDSDPYQKVPPPNWTFQPDARLINSATAIVSLPKRMNIYADDNDLVAAFIDNQCMGNGKLVISNDGTHRVYILTIRAADNVKSDIVFRYYSAKLSYVYRAKQTFPFETDVTFGTFDEPLILDLEYVEQGE